MRWSRMIPAVERKISRRSSVVRVVGEVVKTNGCV
jgi:hypothetical protein